MKCADILAFNWPNQLSAGLTTLVCHIKPSISPTPVEVTVALQWVIVNFITCRTAHFPHTHHQDASIVFFSCGLNIVFRYSKENVVEEKVV